jgi:hypothetical protein
LVKKFGLTLAQIPAKYAVHTTQINSWQQQLAYLPDAFSEKNQPQLIAHNNLRYR